MNSSALKFSAHAEPDSAYVLVRHAQYLKKSSARNQRSLFLPAIPELPRTEPNPPAGKISSGTEELGLA